ncbi:MAG: phytoene synthase [Micrococcales bacterium]|nr:MAG: phytoene synthase [Micrococcales bacterium]
MWALYGFARYADEFVDSLTDPDPDALMAWGARVEGCIGTGAGFDAPSRALIATMRRWDIDAATVRVFLNSMRMDIDVAHYPTYPDLERYMDGSAAAVGVQLLPILEPSDQQLTNFIRDIGEDLERGRVYLPMEDLDRFDVTTQELQRCRYRQAVTAPVRNLLQFQIFRARQVYARAEPGIDMLHPDVRPAIRCARTLYGEILDEVERADYRILHRKVAVSKRRRARVAATAVTRARAQWRRTRAVAA